MKALVHLLPMGLAALLPALFVTSWLGGAEASLRAAEPGAKNVAVAAMAEEGYCTQELKQIVRRVAGACGLLDAAGRGCQPNDAARIVELGGEDFNALFLPMRERVHIIQFDKNVSELDDGAREAIEAAWARRGGASFFFAVARASPEGTVEHNQALSSARAQAVLAHLEARFADPDIRKRVGLLWLGEEFAQLSTEFCQWNRSREGTPCDDKEINRSAIIAWIDCAI